MTITLDRWQQLPSRTWAGTPKRRRTSIPAITALDIPFELQADPASNRMCGAAALCMVYRSFGIRCSQAELAVQLTSPGPFGGTGTRSYLLAQDALGMGLSAIALRARDPLGILKTCHNRQLRAILNHRPRQESPSGHFTVLVDLAGDDVVVHDPLVGPNTRIPRNQLLELWRPLGAASEITGNVLVVVAKNAQSAAPCRTCGTPIPKTFACTVCRQSIPLRPASVLGCMSPSCGERAWDALFCPHCDTALVAEPREQLESPHGPKTSETGSSAGAKAGEIDDDPLKIVPLNQEIDKFLALLLSANEGRPVPGAERYFTTIRSIQSELLDFQKQQAVELRAKAAQPPPAPPVPPTPPPIPTPAPESVGTQPPPRPPMDWNELAGKLLEEIGRRPK